MFQVLDACHSHLGDSRLPLPLALQFLNLEGSLLCQSQNFLFASLHNLDLFNRFLSNVFLLPLDSRKPFACSLCIGLVGLLCLLQLLDLLTSSLDKDDILLFMGHESLDLVLKNLVLAFLSLKFLSQALDLVLVSLFGIEEGALEFLVQLLHKVSDLHKLSGLGYTRGWGGTSLHVAEFCNLLFDTPLIFTALNALHLNLLLRHCSFWLILSSCDELEC